jgi:2-phosphosulfolactate phosphatase
LNATAVGKAAASAAAERGLGIAVVCSGEEGGSTVSLEDIVGAGAIVDAVLDVQRGASRPELTDAALAALTVYRADQDHEHAALRGSRHARDLESLGLGEDVAFCARRDAFTAVPYLSMGTDGPPVLRRYSSDSRG